MKILLAAVNAKYIHSNLAVYCLKSYAASKGQEAEIAEYTINQQTEEVLRDLYERNADVVAFSCYIWNIEFIKAVIKDYKKIRPQCEIWLGGPEVSYRAEELLAELPEVRGVMVGEGEEIFAKLAKAYREELSLNEISGIAVRENNGEILTTEPAEPLDFSALPFPYGDENLSFFDNRIIYYESSRGCPFSCAYCLSSLDKRVRFRNMDLVKKELKFFLDRQVPQVKFIDRTFNINGPRTVELLQFIKENDNAITNFHFEVAAELLTKEQIELLNSLRPGLVQLEIGVQSTNSETLTAVNRKTELSELKKTVAAVRKKNNVHIHLDLIAGLPKEDLDSFKKSFNEVYEMNPHQLQLGFLKVLSGAPMEGMAAENEIVYQSAPPYEVLSTNWLSYEDIILLKKVEELVEVYYNSGQFVYSMMYLQKHANSPFELYEKLAMFYEEKSYAGLKLSRNKRYEILWEFAKETLFAEDNDRAFATGPATSQIFAEILFFDYCLREKPKSRPCFAMQSRLDKQELKETYLSFGVKREEEGMHDIEQFSFDPVETAEQGKVVGKPCQVLFSYERRDAMYGGAVTKKNKQ
ncbi:MAG: B12-binding domain-containing radical SAM protein [Lachnospiraceae bacterium]|nr:B12-binding domain-containing radical SAM protein [Lachnospiraceae bacterium]